MTSRWTKLCISLKVTTYDTVFIEDLDRFNQPNIFIKLRELNTVINNYDNIKRKVVFIYAIKDDISKMRKEPSFLILLSL